MKYEWTKVGDQDSKIRKWCCLGSIRLEIVERHWDDEKLYMECFASQWVGMMYMKIVGSSKVIESRRHTKNCTEYCEDWYAEHILLPKLMLGEDEKDS